MEELYKKITKTDSCWIWNGRLSTGGYGRFSYKSRETVVHRFIYEALIGKIKNGMHLDHLCRNRKCVNPKHLEPVTPIENIMRGYGVGAINARKNKCIHGHELSGNNLIVRHVLNNRGNKTIYRQCRICKRRFNKEYSIRKKQRTPYVANTAR